jgi:hypothetical protein
LPRQLVSPKSDEGGSKSDGGFVSPKPDGGGSQTKAGSVGLKLDGELVCCCRISSDNLIAYTQMKLINLSFDVSVSLPKQDNNTNCQEKSGNQINAPIFKKKTSNNFEFFSREVSHQLLCINEWDLTFLTSEVRRVLLRATTFWTNLTHGLYPILQLQIHIRDGTE